MAMWPSGEYCNWQERISKDKPNVPPKSIRNLRPLYENPKPVGRADG